MRAAALLLLALAASAQEEKKAGETKPEVTPAPKQETYVSGSIEFGYRAVLNQSGNTNAYRSVVNLGEGPKLFDADLRFHDRASKLFDEASLLMRNWGGEPYSTLRADVRKTNLYNFLVDYRDLSHFNYLPSFANPLSGTGSLVNQNAFDSRIRSTDLRLELLPSRRITPYVAYSRNTEAGGGVWLFSRQGNDYPVPTFIDHGNNHYRGGLSFNYSRVHVSLEGGGTRFRDDQGSSEKILNLGNLRRPYLGQQLRLAGLSEEYRVRGDSYYSRAAMAINPLGWISLSGVFTYTNPTVDVAYAQNSTGTFVIPQLLVAASGGTDSLRGFAQLPRPSGSLRGELRPWRRLRIVNTWMTDRFHNAASAELLERYLVTGGAVSFRTSTADRLAVNQSQNQVDAFLDVTRSLTIRGGHRYQWGDGTVRATAFLGLPFESAKLDRHVGLAGVSYRHADVVRLNADFEAASTGAAYFRTSLGDYRKFRARGSYAPQPAGSWRASFDYLWLDNENPDPAVRWDFDTRVATAVFEWFPREGKRYSVIAEYTRSGSHSRIDTVAPQTFARDRSDFREAGNAGTLLVTIHPGAGRARMPGLAAGGTYYSNAGSRPTRYYMPQARVSLPLSKGAAANVEWRWYSLAERFYYFENFGSHQLLVSLTLRR